MSDINLNITPATIPASTRSQSFSVAGGAVQSEVPTVRVAEALLPTANAVKENGQHQLNSGEVKASVAEGDKLLKAINRDLQFQIDDATKQVVVKIVNSKTGEVIRQIPSADLLDFIRVMKEQEENAGKLLRDKA